MKFREIEKVWQTVFELGWQSFKEGNLPIAAIITDDDGNILSSGRNHYITSKRFPNCKVDHAETECIQSLDIAKYPELKSYTLYTSMEPCPMCIGTIIMSNLRYVRITARDTWAGASDICEKSAYAQKKRTEIAYADERLANVQIALQGYSELKITGLDSLVYKSFASSYPAGASAAYDMFQKKTLDRFVEENAPFGEVFDYVAELISE